MDEYRLYLDFKAAFYKAYAFCFTGIAAFAKDTKEDCAKALRLFVQSREALVLSEDKAKLYAKAGTKRGSYHSNLGLLPTDSVIFKQLREWDTHTHTHNTYRERERGGTRSDRPSNQCFNGMSTTTTTVKELNQADERARREAGFIYHVSAAAETQEAEPSKSLVQPIAFQFPEKSKSWLEAEFRPDLVPKPGASKSADLAAEGGQLVSPAHSDQGSFCIVS